jgi:hypothetical protein
MTAEYSSSDRNAKRLSGLITSKTVRLTEKRIGYKMHVSSFNSRFVRNIFHSDKYLQLAVPGHALLWLSLINAIANPHISQITTR